MLSYNYLNKIYLKTYNRMLLLKEFTLSESQNIFLKRAGFLEQRNLEKKRENEKIPQFTDSFGTDSIGYIKNIKKSREIKFIKRERAKNVPFNP